jgi:riboflavin biosynthesis pyrimidine reductase
VWQDLPDIEHQGDAMRDYSGIWQAADKLVYSTTLAAVSTPRTRLERSFDPTQVRTMVRSLDRDASIGGPTLAAHALRAGVVDEVHVFALPVVVGGGTACWPPRTRLWFDLVDQTPFLDGTIHLHYRPRR